MWDSRFIGSYNNLLSSPFLYQENSLYNGLKDVSIIVDKKKIKNRKKSDAFKPFRKPIIAFCLSNKNTSKEQRLDTKYFSMPKQVEKCSRNGYKLKPNSKYPFRTKFIVNVVSEHRFDQCLNPFNNQSRTKLKIYRCQLSAPEDSCCCSCNSDAMFEVMKSLYDCYKKKNCDNCNCVLCGHLQQEERMLGEIKKSIVAVGLDTTGAKERRSKVKKAEKALDGKTAAEKEKVLKELARTKQPLPEGRSPSEKNLIKKVRDDLGLPPEPQTPAEKAIMRKAEAAGIITPLEGKTPAQKEKILRAQAGLGIPLPDGKTQSDKALIDKINAESGVPTGIPPEKIRKARAAGLITPLEGKTPEQKEKILKGLGMHGLPLPEGKTPSDKKLIDKIRAKLGLPSEPKTKAMKEKHLKAAKAGFLKPLEGKSPKEKDKILQGLHDMDIPLPEGRTPSEKSLIAKVKARPKKTPSETPSDKIKKAKEAGLLTPLKGKTPDRKEKILRGLAMAGFPLPEGQTPSDKNLINKVRTDLGVPIEPKTRAIRDKHEQAAREGKLLPLEHKTPAQKEKILQSLHDMDIPLPIGRTPSEKSLIARIMAGPKQPSDILAPPERLRKAKAEGLLTPLKGKTPAQKEKILKGLAKHGMPLPAAKSPSEKKTLDKIRAELGLPPEPKTPEMRDKYAKAADKGLLLPLEGRSPKQKEKILQGLHDMGLPLPEGRTPSEKSLIGKVKTRPRKSKVEGVTTPLKGKSPAQKEKILRGLAMAGIPLPEGETPSEAKLIDKVRTDLGVPIEPKTKAIRGKHEKAAREGKLLPLENKTPAQKEKILKDLHDMGIPLPIGRTPSEKALIANILGPPDKLRKAKSEGLLTPLKRKTPAQKEKILRGLAMAGIPLPEGETPSEAKLIDKVRTDLGVPTEPKTKAIRDKHEQAAREGKLLPLENKTPAQKEKILKGLHDMGIPLPIGRTPSEKALIAKIMAGPRALSGVLAPSERMRKAKAEGLITPLKGKPPDQKEKILRGLAMAGIPLPEGKTSSDKNLINKVRTDLGVPIEPKTKAIRDKHEQAAREGKLLPLEHKTPAQKEKILQALHDMDIPLPIGRTPSEKSLIARIMAGPRPPSGKLVPSEKLRKAKAEGLLTPLKGKSPAHKEKLLRGLAMAGIPLPVGETPSEARLIDKVRTDLGVPIEPKTKAIRDKHDQAAKEGKLLPLEGKTPAQKEKILQDLHDMGIPLPIGRTPSEKALIAKIMAGPRAPPSVLAPSERLRKAKAEGLLSPLKDKTPDKKEKILRGLAMAGFPLPEGQTPSDKNLINKVRTDLGVPIEPKTKAIRDKHEQAAREGKLLPLENKTPAQKEKILQALHDMDIPLPIGRTPSEKSLIARIMAGPRPPSEKLVPSEKLRKTKAEGLLTPLKGKSPAHKEKLLRGLAMAGIPLPEGETPSEAKLIDKVRTDLGVPIEPKTKAIRDKHDQAAKEGKLLPLEGKTPAQKEKILQDLHDMGIPLPIGRTPSEKALIGQIMAGPRALSSVLAPSEKMRKAKAEGLLSPLKGKTPDRKEKILRGLAMAGFPLPEGKTPSDKNLINKVRTDLGVPVEPKTKAIRDKHEQAAREGKLLPLEHKTPAQKEKILQALHDMDIPLPIGRTPSEKALIAKIMAGPSPPSEKLRKATAAGLLTPMEGKTPAQKEKILRGRAAVGLPLPVAATPSDRALLQKVKDDTGYVTPSPSERLRKAKAAGLVTPLKGKTPAMKEKVLKDMIAAGVPLPEGETPSDKALIRKIISSPKKSRSEKIKQAKADGLLTPLKGKTPEEKQKILKGLVKADLPLPEPKTESDRDLIDKVREEVGLPPEPTTPTLKEKYKKAQAAGLITPLEGKTPAEKENILKKLHDAGIPLPDGRTPSEKTIIRRLKSAIPTRKTPSEKLKAAKSAGFLTPLEGKTPAQKEKVLKGLVKTGLPLPEGKTPSEKDMIKKIRSDMGLPPEPKTPAMREKMQKAHAAGIITPLEGKTPAQKKNILKALADAGIPLPEGRTPSEKTIIASIKAEPKPSRVPSEKLRKAKAAGVLTPLEGKKPAEKEKILRGLADAGLPLPEGKTSSDKSLVHKIRTELGIPPPAKTASEKSVISKAKAAGLFTPITGKPPAEKERILRGLAEAGLPLPVGKTPSEKDLIKKVRSDIGLAPKATQSEKMGKIKTKVKKVGSKASRQLAKGVDAEEFEDIIKKTTCDRGCGCDKKKIRFKHSYVKIRVTSPDISSLCSCSHECIPGVKAGAFIDNEGIKVTVGSAVGSPIYSREGSKVILNSTTDHVGNYRNGYKSAKKVHSVETGLTIPKFNYIPASISNASRSTRPNSTESENMFLQSSTPPYEGRTNQSEWKVKSSGDWSVLENIIDSDNMNRSHASKIKSPSSSVGSLLVIKSETSLSLRTSSTDSMDVIGVMSDSSITYNSTHCSGCQSTDELSSLTSFYGPTTSFSENLHNNPNNIRTDTGATAGLQREYAIFRMSQTQFSNVNKNITMQKEENNEPVVVFNNIPSKLDINKIMDKILTKKRFSCVSSIFIVIPTSDDNEPEDGTKGLNSIHSIKSTGINLEHPDPSLMKTPSTNICGKGKRFYMKEILSNEKVMQRNEFITVLNRNKKKKNKICQFPKPDKMEQIPGKIGRIVGTDTTADGPCCCRRIQPGTTGIQSIPKDQLAISKRIIPIFLKPGNMSTRFNLLPTALRPEYRISPCFDISSSRPMRDPCHHHHRHEYGCHNDMQNPLPYNNNMPCRAPLKETKSMGMITELKGSEIQSLQTNYAERNSSQTKMKCNLPNCDPTTTEKKCACKEVREWPEYGKLKQDKAFKGCVCRGSTPKSSEQLEENKTKAILANLKYSQSIQTDTLKMGPVTKICSKIPKLFSKGVKTSFDQRSQNEQICKSTSKITCTGSPTTNYQYKNPSIAIHKTFQVDYGGNTDTMHCNATVSPMSSDNVNMIFPNIFEYKVQTSDTSCECTDIKQAKQSSSLEKKLLKNANKKPKAKFGLKPHLLAQASNKRLPPDMAYAYEAYGPSSCGWEDTGELMKIKSQLTITTSGFKMFKRKKLKTEMDSSEGEIPLDFEDFVRYYAFINPRRFRELIREEQQKKLEALSGGKKKSKCKLKARKKCKKNVKDVCDPEENKEKEEWQEDDLGDFCECPYGPIPPPINYDAPKPSDLEGPTKGLKFSIGGKGSGSPGLAGVACFDMSLESYASW